MPTATTRAQPLKKSASAPTVVVPLRQRAPDKPRSPLSAKRATQQFDLLPDSAVVPIATAAAVLSLGVSTVREIAERDSRFELKNYGTRMTRVKVSGIRAFMAGGNTP